MISVDDIAALAVIANRDAPFNHRIDRQYVDVRWILDCDADGTSPVRFRHGSRTVSPERKHAAAPKPKTLATLDCSKSIADVPDSAALINSPRSALVILKNGFAVADLLGVPEKAIRNQALLDGATGDAVKLRLKADAKRRETRREIVAVEYAKLCDAADRDAVVEAIRDHHFAMLRQQKKNDEATRKLEPLAPGGKLDLTLLDDECVDVVKQSRARAAEELRRVVNQQQRQKERLLRKEEEMLRAQSALAGEAQNSNVHRDRAIRAKVRAVRQHQQRQAERSTRNLAAQRDKEEMKRSTLLAKMDESLGRASLHRTMTMHATTDLVEDRERRRAEVRDRERLMLEERRDDVEQKASLKDRLMRRNIELRDEALRQKRIESEEVAARRREELKKSAAAQAAAREAKSLTLQEEAEIRAAEIAEAKAARLEAKKQRALDKEVRRRAAHEAREEKRKQMLAELDEAQRRKEEAIATAEEERKRAIVIANEQMSQVRLERAEEQRRAKSVAEFKYVGYVSANNHKTEWIEREAEKRKTVAAHMRQEREALLRAKDDVLHDLESVERAERRRLELSYR